MSFPDPRYLGEHGEISATFRRASEHGPDLKIGDRAIVNYLATGESTHGLFGLYKWELRANTPGTKAHFHRTMSESFFILSGKVRLFNGERWMQFPEIFFTFRKVEFTISEMNLMNQLQC